MRLQDRSLVIREAAAEDAKLLWRWWNDGKVMEHAGFPRGLGISEEEVVELLTDGDPNQHRLILEVDSRPVGEMNYRDLGDGTAQIGIKICDFQQQGKGYGPRFLRLLIRHLFEEAGYSKIVLDTNLKNTRAQHVYEKLGFRKVRTRINAWKDQLGELQSAVDYELTAEDFVHE